MEKRGRDSGNGGHRDGEGRKREGGREGGRDEEKEEAFCMYTLSFILMQLVRW